MKIRPDQMDGDLLQKAGFDKYEVWSCGPSSNLAKKARQALLSFPEGRAHIESIESSLKEEAAKERATFRNLCKWAERFGKTPPSKDEIRDYDGSYICKVNYIEESFQDAVKESALEAFGDLPLPKKGLRVSGEKVYFGGLIGSWDGFDISWRLDEDEIKRSEVKEEPEKGAPHVKHDFDNPRHHGWS